MCTFSLKPKTVSTVNAKKIVPRGNNRLVFAIRGLT